MRLPTPRPTDTDTDTSSDMLVEALATRAAAGDSGALGELYERYADPTFRFIATRVRGTTAAEDVNGDLWLRVSRTIKMYSSRGPGSFAGWLFTIARNLIVNHYRKTGRCREQVTGDMLALDVATMRDGADDLVDRLDGERLVADALAELTSDQRECVELRFFDGLTVADTASAMSSRGKVRNANAVKQLQFRALNKLAAVLPPQTRNCVYGPSVRAVVNSGSDPAS